MRSPCTATSDNLCIATKTQCSQKKRKTDAETGAAEALCNSQRMEKQELSLQINFSTHFGQRHQILKRVEEMWGNWKVWEEYSWVIGEQGCGWDLALMQPSFSVLLEPFLVVVMVIVNCQGMMAISLSMLMHSSEHIMSLKIYCKSILPPY